MNMPRSQEEWFKLTFKSDETSVNTAGAFVQWHCHEWNRWLTNHYKLVTWFIGKNFRSGSDFYHRMDKNAGCQCPKRETGWQEYQVVLMVLLQWFGGFSPSTETSIPLKLQNTQIALTCCCFIYFTAEKVCRDTPNCWSLHDSNLAHPRLSGMY